MISLKDAMMLCNIKDDEIVYICNEEEGFRYARPIAGEKIKKKFDLKHTMVRRIKPRFLNYEWAGFSFVLAGAENTY